MALPRMSKEEKLLVIRALQESNDVMDYPGFNNHAERYGPYVVTEYWSPEMDEFPGYQVIGPGPVIVDTRDYSVDFLGSIPTHWPDWLNDNSLPRGRVKLADEPFPGHPTSDLPDDDS